MSEWTFKVFLKDKDHDVINDWIDGLPQKVQARIEARISYLRVTDNWVRPYFDKLSGHIHEIRVVHGRIQYRILGCFGPGREFTMLIGAVEKDWKLPKHTEEIAEERYKLVSEDRGYADVYI